MKRLIVLSLILLVFLAGCAAQQKAEQGKVKKGTVLGETKSQIKFNIEETKMGKGDHEIEIEKATPKMEAEIKAGDVEVGNGWCKEGSAWNFKSTAPDMQASGEWIIKGLMTSGEYKGLCHVEYKMQTPEGETTMDYYFAENGESGYFEMKMPNGQVVKQEWTG